MTNAIAGLSPRQAARVAGVGYLFIIVLAVFAEFFVRSALVVPDSAAATVKNLVEAQTLFRAGICAYVVAAVCDAIVALALYVLLSPVNPSLALLAAWLRLVHATIFAAAVNNLISALRLAVGAEASHAQVMLLLDAFNSEWLIGLVFFGLHCFVLGYLISKSSFMPKVLGALLIVASMGYLTDGFAQLLLHNYSDYEAIFLPLVALPALVAEVALCVWLLAKAASLEQQPSLHSSAS